MISKQLLVVIVVLSLSGVLESRVQEQFKEKKPFCGQNKRACKDLNNKCQCYCSWKCGPRDKTPKDNPVYVENDPAGIYCYCAPRDYKHYYDRGCHLREDQRFISANED